jgi:ubiquinone/menaquinone biosynthesis C-methylase UbiE
MAGPGGRVIGIDVTPEMIEKARVNAGLAGFGNVTFRESDMANLPLPDACARVVISNGAINLSPHKPCVVKHALRILKPGGRLYIADMVRETSRTDIQNQAVPSKVSPVAWASCVAGTVSPEGFTEFLRQAGFIDVEFVGTTGYRTSAETIGALFRARRGD